MSSSEQRTSRLVPFAGGLGILMVAVGVVIGAVQTLRPVAGADAPALMLLSPSTGDTVASPVRLRFTAGDRLRLGPMGWASDDLHLHVYVDGREIMPAAADIAAADDGTFGWHLPLEPGVRRVRLQWAGMDHGAVTAGRSREITVLVR